MATNANGNGKRLHRPGGLTGGSIAAGELYTLDEVRARLGIGQTAMRNHRRRGLPVRKIGARRVVLGDELIAWVRSQGRSEETQLVE